MFDQHFLSSAAPTDVFGPLQGGERMMWRGRCGVAEYAFDEAASLPRWTLPETTDVLVTDHRVLYAYTAEDGHQVKSGELRWLWPQHLRVQPGARSNDRGAAATQIQMVCGGADGTYPALVFAGGDLATVGDADRLANVIRQAIARFRVDNADKLGLTPGQARMLSRMLIGPEFRNHQGGEGQTVSLLGAMLVSRPVPAPALPAVASVMPVSVPSAPLPLEMVSVSADAITVSADAVRLSAEAALLSAEAARWAADADTVLGDPISVSADAITVEEFVLPVVSTAARSTEALPTEALPTEEVARPIAEGTRLIYRPGMAADAARALMAAKAEEAAQQAEPALASRAADLAARVANLIARSTAEPDAETVAVPGPESSMAGVGRGARRGNGPERGTPSEAVPERGASRRVLPQRRASRRAPEREAPTVVGPEPEAETVIVPEMERIVPPAGPDDGATWEVHRSAWRAEGAHRDSSRASDRRPRHSEPRIADPWHSKICGRAAATICGRAAATICGRAATICGRAAATSAGGAVSRTGSARATGVRWAATASGGRSARGSAG